MSIGAIIQARTGSKRLPSKVLRKLVDKNLLEHILFRLSFLKKVKIVVATSTLRQDDKIEKVCIKHNISCFRGSHKNVLKRYYFCAKKNGFKHILRLTGDNPFIDIEEIDNLITLHLETKADYSNSFSALPKGVGSEIFTFNALEKSYKYGNTDNHKEHVNEYIEENKSMFKISKLKVIKEKNRPNINLSIDTIADYKKACLIISNNNNKFVTTQDAIKICSQFV